MYKLLSRVAIGITVFGLACACGVAAPSVSNGSQASSATVGARSYQQPTIVASASTLRLLHDQSATTSGSVTIDGTSIPYTAVAGTLVVDGTGKYSTTPSVAMGYFAYFKKGTNPSKRPITFIYDGGPGSSTIWMMMGGFAPERVVTNDNTITGPAPYTLVNNQYSLLNATDMVFIDAPGTGFSRLLPTGKSSAARAADRRRIARSVWGVSGDAQVFSRFITTFLSKYGRWNSPKYIFGESYGTTRSAVLADILEQQDGVDLNGVIMQSQVLSYHDEADHPAPGDDMAYVLVLPSYAATAWYHRKLPKYDSDGLNVVLDKAIRFATTAYRAALFQGNTLSASARRAVASQLHDLIGLPTSYLMKARLRVSSTMFTHELLSKGGQVTGRPDTRFAGYAMSPLAERTIYDPLIASISSPYNATFNTYVRHTLNFGRGMRYRLFIGPRVPDFSWNNNIPAAPGERGNFGSGGVNVIQYLADAMIFNPHLKVMLNGGFYDVACPFYAAIYQFTHLPIPQRLESNITYAFYPSGHTIYVHVPSLARLHANITNFIAGSSHT